MEIDKTVLILVYFIEERKLKSKPEKGTKQKYI